MIWGPINQEKTSSYKSITPELISQVFVTMTKMKINIHKKPITLWLIQHQIKQHKVLVIENGTILKKEECIQHYFYSYRTVTLCL